MNETIRGAENRRHIEERSTIAIQPKGTHC